MPFNEIEVVISIDGTELSTFTTFTLNQSMYDHHWFQLVLKHNIVEDLGSHIMDKSRSWIGKDLVAVIGDSNEFNGIITSVDMNHFHGFNGDLVIKGYSPTILLEAGPHKQSWNDSSLEQIITKVIEDSGISANVQPDFKAPITYMSQYRETHFEFLKRMSGSYYEWMYYDGTTLNFGKPTNLPETRIVYGIDLENIELSMKMNPVSFQGFSYQADRDESMVSTSSNPVSGMNDLGLGAYDASDQAFSIRPRSALEAIVSTKSELDQNMERKRSAKAAKLTWISGSGTSSALRPGVVAQVEAAVKENGQWEFKPYGSYLIMNVEHHITGNSTYRNRFEAIPAGLEVPPVPEYHVPVGEPQVATVISNQDPKSQGRVQVKMLWQDGDMKSPWLRVLTPDAGSSDQVGANRGFVFIPEVGDQVMVGFRYNDPSRPFIMGSLFHGLVGGGGGASNASKSLTTRSGAIICLNDDEGEGSISIADPSGNVVLLKGDGTMEITAPNQLDLNSTSININASQNLTIGVGMNMTTTVGMNKTESAGMNIVASAGVGIQSSAGMGIAMTGGKNIGINAGSGSSIDLKANGIAKVASQKKIQLDSKGKFDVLAKKKAVIAAKNIDVAGKSKTKVKGGKVEVQ